MKLLGKKAIVTGANRTIGAEIARLFADEVVSISYRSDLLVQRKFRRLL